MFSPYYRWARTKNPWAHCALNVALYAPRKHYWAMTERSARDVSASSNAIAIGRSAAQWDGSALHLRIEETAAPLPGPIQGEVTVTPETISDAAFALDDARKHWWRPLAPHARIDVRFAKPALAWRGAAYCDMNWGVEPLSNAFRAWHWQREHTPDGALVHYDIAPRRGAPRLIALRYDAQGRAQPCAAQDAQALPGTFWGVSRVARGDARLVKTLEDTPFYARSALAGAHGDIVHETVSLDRFDQPIVQAMLPFRMPRLVLGR
ncbi:MAG: hypothetical protein NW203_10345 [Hyphomonadaceae bacterium]|nr:hypothetical protein [Hyphomonadaceae bacterium]